MSEHKSEQANASRRLFVRMLRMLVYIGCCGLLAYWQSEQRGKSGSKTHPHPPKPATSSFRTIVVRGLLQPQIRYENKKGRENHLRRVPGSPGTGNVGSAFNCKHWMLSIMDGDSGGPDSCSTLCLAKVQKIDRSRASPRRLSEET